MVEKVRDIFYDLGENPDEFCPIAEGDKPWLVRLEALMHDTCNTAEAAAQSIIDEKEQKGIEFFGEEAWAALPVEARATFDVDCSKEQPHSPARQFPVPPYVEAAPRVPAPRLSGRGEVAAWTLHAS